MSIDIEQAKKIIFEQNPQINLSDSEIDLEIERKIAFLQREKNNTQLDLKERNDVIGMRKLWARWLLFAIIAIIVFDFFVIVCVGFGGMKFDKGYIIPFFVGESLLKTLGLAMIVVNFLFNKEFIKKGDDK